MSSETAFTPSKIEDSTSSTVQASTDDVSWPIDTDTNACSLTALFRSPFFAKAAKQALGGEFRLTVDVHDLTVVPNGNDKPTPLTAAAVSAAMTLGSDPKAMRKLRKAKAVAAKESFPKQVAKNVTKKQGIKLSAKEIDNVTEAVKNVLKIRVRKQTVGRTGARDSKEQSRAVWNCLDTPTGTQVKEGAIPNGWGLGVAEAISAGFDKATDKLEDGIGATTSSLKTALDEVMKILSSLTSASGIVGAFTRLTERITGLLESFSWYLKFTFLTLVSALVIWMACRVSFGIAIIQGWMGILSFFGAATLFASLNELYLFMTGKKSAVAAYCDGFNQATGGWLVELMSRESGSARTVASSDEEDEVFDTNRLRHRKNTPYACAFTVPEAVTDFAKTVCDWAAGLGVVVKDYAAFALDITRVTTKVKKLTDFVSWIYSVSERFIFAAQRDDYNLRDLINNNPLKHEVCDWLERSKKVLTVETFSAVFSKPDLAKYVTDLGQEGLELSNRMARVGMNDVLRGLTGSVESTKRALAGIIDTAISAQTSNATRVKPVCVLAHGVPGTGKTKLMEKLSLDVLNHLHLGTQHTSSTDIYQRNAGDAFFSGYHGQLAYNIDDFWQTTEATKVMDSYEEVIDAINTGVWRLNMAKAEEKGRVTFRSEVVTISTNHTLATLVGIPKSIADIGALRRRLHITVEPVPRADYITKSFAVDHAKVEEALYNKVLDDYTDAFTYKVSQICGNDSTWVPVSKAMDYRELLALVVDRAYEHRREFLRSEETMAPALAAPTNVAWTDLAPDCLEEYQDKFDLSETELKAKYPEGMPFHSSETVWRNIIMCDGMRQRPTHEMWRYLRVRVEKLAVAANNKDILALTLDASLACRLGMLDMALARCAKLLRAVEEKRECVIRYSRESWHTLSQRLKGASDGPPPETPEWRKIFARVAMGLGVAAATSLGILGMYARFKKGRDAINAYDEMVRNKNLRDDSSDEGDSVQQESRKSRRLVGNDDNSAAPKKRGKRKTRMQVLNEETGEHHSGHAASRGAQRRVFPNSDEVFAEASDNERVTREDVMERMRSGYYSDVASKMERGACSFELTYQVGGKSRTSRGHGLIIGKNRVLTAAHIFAAPARAGVDLDWMCVHTSRGTYEGKPMRWQAVPRSDILLFTLPSLTTEGEWPELDKYVPENEYYDEMNCLDTTYVLINTVKVKGGFIPHCVPANIGGVVECPYTGRACFAGIGPAARGYSGSPLVRCMPNGPALVGILSLSNNSTNVLTRSHMWCAAITANILAEMQDVTLGELFTGMPPEQANADNYGDLRETFEAGERTDSLQRVHPRGVLNAMQWHAQWPQSNPQPIVLYDNVYRNTETRIVESIFHGCTGPVDQQPPVLVGPQGQRDLPFLKNAAKLADVCSRFEPAMLAEAERHVLSMFRHYLKGGYPRRSWRFAVQGHKAAYVEPLVLDTSAGWPYRSEGWDGPREKRDLLVGADGEKEPGPVLLGRINMLLERITSDGFDPEQYPFTDTLKDETRPPGKDPRVFQVGNLEMNLLLRILYGDLIADVIQNHAYLPIKVGLNPFDDDQWTRLGNYLLMNSLDKQVRKESECLPCYIAGDFSNFDKMLSRQLMESVFRILDAMYEGPRARESGRLDVRMEDAVLHHNEHRARIAARNWVINSVHISQGFQYTTDHGNPSGNVLTTLMNSVANWLLTVMCIESLHHERECFAPDFGAEYRMAFFGDDVVIHCSNWHGVEPLVTQHTMTAWYAEHNIKFTNAQKTMVSQPLLHVSQVEFLKRSFKRDGVWFSAPLRLESVRNMLYWCEKKNKLDWDTVNQIIRSASVELVIWGKHVFDPYIRNVREALTAYLESPHAHVGMRRVVIPSWEQAVRWREAQSREGAVYIC